MYVWAKDAVSFMSSEGIFDRDYCLMAHGPAGVAALLVARLAPRKPLVFLSLEGSCLRSDGDSAGGLARRMVEQGPSLTREGLEGLLEEHDPSRDKVWRKLVHEIPASDV